MSFHSAQYDPYLEFFGYPNGGHHILPVGMYLQRYVSCKTSIAYDKILFVQKNTLFVLFLLPPRARTNFSRSRPNSHPVTGVLFFLYTFGFSPNATFKLQFSERTILLQCYLWFLLLPQPPITFALPGRQPTQVILLSLAALKPIPRADAVMARRCG